MWSFKAYLPGPSHTKKTAVVNENIQSFLVLHEQNMDVEDQKNLIAPFPERVNGGITVADLVKVLRKLGQTVKENEAEVSSNGINFIDNGQLVKMMEANDESEDIRTSFSLFDTDGDGQITAAELRHQLTEFKEHITDEQVGLIQLVVGKLVSRLILNAKLY